MSRITADTIAGRILLALRAGKMQPEQLSERNLNSGHHLTSLVSKKLVEKDSEGAYRLTESGRAACPTRRKTDNDRQNLALALHLKGNAEAQRAHRAVNREESACA